MTIKITSVPGKDKTILRVEGHVDVRGVEDMKTMIQSAPGPVHLDLSGLLSADAEAFGALHNYRQMQKLFGHSIPILPLA